MTSTVILPSTASRSRPALDFEALYRDARDDLYAYVATLLREPAGAEDVTAQAFERAYRRAGTFDPARGSERAWLFGIARHAALDELRRQRRTARLAADPPDPGAAGAEDFTEAALRHAALTAALATLSVRDREVVALRFHAGLETAEVAEVLGISRTNAATQLHRAMTKLREALDAR